MQSIERVRWPGWDVVRLIGRGSFGAVYEIQRDVFGETERAALKVITIPENSADIEDLRVEGYDDESITSRFHNYLEDIVKEYSTMAKMKGHPNVVYCDDVQYIQHDDGIGWDIYIKMELLTPIMKCLDQVENEQAVIDLGIAMCNALVLCKERSIVHRDIKPQNIFVSRDGTFKLGDFGIAKTAERTTSGTKVGTYKYMAPEVYNNRPYGPAADQYSLGLVMYCLLNDRRTPFSPKKATASEEDLARKRRFDGEQIPPPAHGSKQLQAIVLRACAYDPKDRFASAAEMRSALEALKHGDLQTLNLLLAQAGTDTDTNASTIGRINGNVAKECSVELNTEAYNEGITIGRRKTLDLFNDGPERQDKIGDDDSAQQPVRTKRGTAFPVIIAAIGVLTIAVITLAIVLLFGKDQKTAVPDTSHLTIEAENNHSQGETKEAVAQENVSAPETSPNQTSELNHDPPVDMEEPSRETEADNGEASPSDQAESLSLNHDDITFFAPGENIQLNVVTAPAGKQITWYSENESVATVDQSGHVWASGSGTTLICAVSGDLSASCLVRCNFAQVSDNEGAEIQILSSFVLSDGYDDSEFATSTAISYDAQYNPISYRESASDGVTEYALGYNEGSHMGYSSNYESSLEGSGEQRTEWTFNSDGLVTKEEIFYSSGERTVTYFSYDSAGRLLTAQWIGLFESQIKEYRYNAAGELIQLDITDQDMDGSAVSHSESVENTYTEGRLYSRQFYEDGSLKAEELYDENGNLTRYRDIIAEDWVRVYSYRYESVYIESGQSFPSWYCANCLVRHE